MRGNVVVAAAVFGAAMILSSLLLVFGVRSVVHGAMDRFDASVQAHARSVERAGEQAGGPIQAGLIDMARTFDRSFDRHGQAVVQAGEKISHPTIPENYTIKMQDPIAVKQPLIIHGPADDGALPVNAKLGK